MTAPGTTVPHLEDLLRTTRKALVVGVGGGGDIVGTIPTARFLEQFGISCVLGGLSWERLVYDPQPGTRTLAEVQHVQPLAPTVWLANGQTVTTTGVRFAESGIAALYNTETVLIDLSQGVAGVVHGLRAAMQHLQANLLVGIDVGGDSLGDGSEAGLRSPLADAMMLAALYQLSDEFPCVWGVFGYGSDAELTPAGNRPCFECGGPAWGFTWGLGDDSGGGCRTAPCDYPGAYGSERHCRRVCCRRVWHHNDSPWHTHCASVAGVYCDLLSVATGVVRARRRLSACGQCGSIPGGCQRYPL